MVSQINDNLFYRVRVVSQINDKLFSIVLGWCILHPVKCYESINKSFIMIYFQILCSVHSQKVPIKWASFNIFLSLYYINFKGQTSSTRLFVIQSHEYRTEMHQRLILWCISKILVQPFLSFGAFETAFGATFFEFWCI